MESDLQRFLELKGRDERARREVSRAQGVLDAVLGRLRSELGCGSLEEAERLLRKTKRHEERTGEVFSQALAEFEGKWSDRLSE